MNRIISILITFFTALAVFSYSNGIAVKCQRAKR